MLSTALGFPGDMSHCPLWHWRPQVFPKGCCYYDLKAFCETGYKSVLLNISKDDSYII